MSILAGELGSTMNVATVLQMLARAGHSVLMRVKSGDHEAVVAVRSGKVLWARMNWGQRLGEALVAKRRITPDICSMALRHQRDGQRRMPLGKVLVALGFVSQDDVATEIENMIQRVMSEILMWESGEYSVEPLGDGDQGIPMPAPIESLLLSFAA